MARGKILDWILKWFGGGKNPPVVPIPPSPIPPGEDDLLALHNNERARHHAQPLAIDIRLVHMAQDQAQRMAEQGRRNHDNFTQRLQQSGYSYRSAEENAAIGATAQTAWQEWLRSPGHYANAMNSLMQDVGFGSARGRDGQTYWCAVYGERR